MKTPQKSDSPLRLQSLLFADIFRDGGSFEAAFRDDKGARFVIFLEAHPDSPKRHRLRHGRLFAYHGDEMPGDATPIPPGSQGEQELLRDLEAFLAAPWVEGPEPAHLAPGYSLERLAQMVAYIPKREGA